MSTYSLKGIQDWSLGFGELPHLVVSNNPCIANDFSVFSSIRNSQNELRANILDVGETVRVCWKHKFGPLDERNESLVALVRAELKLLFSLLWYQVVSIAINQCLPLQLAVAYIIRVTYNSADCEVSIFLVSSKQQVAADLVRDGVVLCLHAACCPFHIDNRTRFRSSYGLHAARLPFILLRFSCSETTPVEANSSNRQVWIATHQLSKSLSWLLIWDHG